MKLSFKKIKQLLKSPKQPQILPAPTMTRSFRVAFNNRFINWLFTSSNKVNADLICQFKPIVERSRGLAQNNQLFRSYLTNCLKSIVGAEGFRLQMQIKNADGSLNEALNNQIQWAWYDFTKRGSLQMSQQLGDVDFDTMILRTMLVDGECFIKIIKDNNSPYGVKFQLIDSLCIDCMKNQPFSQTTNAIFNGVEVDHNYRPVRYWIREGGGFGNYEAGQLKAVPADQIIHLYRPEFIDQVRGYSPAIASFESLKQLEDMTNAELIAAKVQSCQGVFYERNSQTPAGDFLGQSDDNGTFLQELSPGVASIVPNGYSVKTLTPNHPNSQYGQFVKAVGKRVASSMGTNYNTLFGDLQNVNYSSLRQANITQQSFYKSWQKYLVQNWKNIQFELFLKGYLINSKTELRPSMFAMYLKEFRFISKTDPSYDISKQILAIDRSLRLGLTSHIQEIQKRGLDPQEVVKDEVKWQQLCKENGLPPNFYDTSLITPLDAVQQFNHEADNGEDNK